MWNVNGNDLTMAEGDYGIALPTTIEDITLTANDEIKIVFKRTRNAEPILEKEFSQIVDNAFNLELTEAESALFPVGNYCYRLDWYQDGAFMCNIITSAAFKVVDKA